MSEIKDAAAEPQYEISVVTPFHNVDMRFFKVAIKSMLDQTIGFEKIQWVIVVHNCEPQYMPELKEMLGGYPNVILEELNNDARTPSSPRNRGVELSTAPYIGYLDADDSYWPNCLAECVRHAKETDAQVVCFRRDYERENESLGSLTEIVLWNQLEERIVIKKGAWDMKRMFAAFWTFVTSKIFDRKFLLKYGITYDETIPFAEGWPYCIQAIAHADRICYLPQLIGYHYFINGHSLVQALTKPSKTLVEYARGFAKIFKMGYDFGMDFNECSQKLMLYLCDFMLHSEVTKEDREEIKRLLGPYVYRTMPIPPSKTTTWEFSNYAFNMCREVILSEEDFKDNQTLQDFRSGLLSLQGILRDNAESDYGQRYQFSTIQTIPAYQFHVPLTRLSTYQKLISLQVSIGEHGILVSDPITGYVRSGKFMVPFSERHQVPYIMAIAKVLKGRHNLWVAQCEMAGKTLNDATRVHSLGSVLVRGYFYQYVFGGSERPASFSAPDGAFFSVTATENDYGLILHHALLDREIDQIVASDATKILRMFRLLETDSVAVLDRVRAVDSARADEVAAVLADFTAGREPCLARRLWHKVNRVVACGTGSHAASRDEVRRFTGDIVWNNGPVILPEVLLAHAEADGSDRYVFDGTDCFCEFFQNDTDDILKPFARSGLQPGHTYNVIVTNRAGLYRVVTDAEIKVVENGVDGLVVEILS